MDPYSTEFQADPHPFYAALRATAPVYKVPGHDFYLVVTAELVRQAVRDPQAFSNEVTAVRRTSPPAELAAELSAVRAQGLAYQPTLSLNDPPRHTRFRKLVQRAFTPRALTWMDPVVTELSRELVAALPADDPLDIVDALARPLPIYAICRILGLPNSWRDDITTWSDAATAALGSSHIERERWLDVEYRMLDLQRALVPEFARRRAAPTDDLLSVLVAPDPEHGALTDAELIWLVRELLVAGNETTTKTITDLILRLDGRPREWQRVRDDPQRATAVVEECLRLASPVQGMFRRVTRPITLGGVDLPEGTHVFLAFGSANRDETVFPAPDEFDPDRPNVRSHLAFGQGIHACLGNALARMEATTVLRELAGTVARIDVLDPAAVRYTRSFVLRGIRELPVRVRRRTPS